MFGIKTGPSFARAMGGATNALAQRFGNPNMRGMVESSGAIANAMNNRRATQMGQPRRGMPIQSGVPQNMPGRMPVPQMPQMPINTAPSPAMMPNMGPPPMMPDMSRNTGIAGGRLGGLFGRFGQY